jgi:hypothetical protein
MVPRPKSSVAARKICHCKDCNANGGLDSNGRPKGVQFASAEYVAHIAVVAASRNQQKAKERAESEEQRKQDALQMQEEIVGLVLSDPGPDLDKQPNKLWTSREEFQESVATPSRVQKAPLDDLARSFSQISLFADSPPPSEPKQSKKYDKREKNHRTVRAKRVLEAIKTQISNSFNALSSEPTYELLQEIELKIGHMRSSVEKITRTTWSLDQAKRETSAGIQRLEARLLECKLLLPPPPQAPLSVANGMTSLYCTVSAKTNVVFMARSSLAATRRSAISNCPNRNFTGRRMQCDHGCFAQGWRCHYEVFGSHSIHRFHGWEGWGKRTSGEDTQRGPTQHYGSPVKIQLRRPNYCVCCLPPMPLHL